MSKYQFGDSSHTVDVEVLHGQLELNKLKVPSTSGGSTNSLGTNGQVLKTNGTTVYWGNDDTVTETTVSGWGFTKNTGTYSKPSGGIPKTDLASDVQTSLGKADTALQEHQDISGKVSKTGDTMSGHLIINNSGYLKGKASDGTVYTVAGVGSNDRVDIGDNSVTTNIYGKDIYTGCNIYMANNVALNQKSADGTNQIMVNWASNNNVHFAAGSYNNSIGNVYLNGNSVNLRTRGSNILANKAYQVSSDRRLKENIKDLPDMSDVFMSIKPREFNWKSNKNSKKEIGVIAQEILESLDGNDRYNIVSSHYNIDENAERLSVNYDAIFMMMLQTVQNQQKRIDELERKIKEMLKEEL